MDAYRGPARIVQDGSTYEVSCDYTVTVDARSGLRSWSGTFHAAPPPNAPDLGDAVLRLPAGDEGRIIITYSNISPNPQRAVFTGTGPAPGHRD